MHSTKCCGANYGLNTECSCYFVSACSDTSTDWLIEVTNKHGLTDLWLCC